MSFLRATLLPCLVAFALIASGCAKPKSEDQRRVDELLESWGGVDPLANLNATMEVYEAVAIEGQCNSHAEPAAYRCHVFQITIISNSTQRFILAPLAFEGILENGQRIRATAIYQTSTIVKGSQNITVTFETTTSHHLTSIRIGYEHSYSSVTVSTYESTSAPPFENVGIRVLNATIVMGRCVDGSLAHDRECHVVNVRVDNSQGDEIPADCFYWYGTKTTGTLERCFDSNADAIVRGANATIQLRFEERAQSGERLSMLEYRSTYLGLYGNATVPAYLDDF